MPRSAPFFSVVIPVFNREDLIQLSVASVLRQSFGDFELILVDDGSTDRSAEVAKKMAPHARLLRIPNSGPALARNAGIRSATGDFVAFLDSDDIWYEDTLAIFRKVIEETNGTIFIAGRLLNVWGNRPAVDSKSRVSPVLIDSYPNFLSARINILVDFGLTSVAVDRKTLLQAGMFSAWRTNYEDMDMWLRLANSGPFAFVQSPPLVIRINHGQNVSQDLAKSYHGITNIASSWQNREYHSETATQVSRLFEGALRNLLGKIHPKDWWVLFGRALGPFLKSKRLLPPVKLFAKGILAGWKRTNDSAPSA